MSFSFLTLFRHRNSSNRKRGVLTVCHGGGATVKKQYVGSSVIQGIRFPPGKSHYNLDEHTSYVDVDAY